MHTNDPPPRRIQTAVSPRLLFRAIPHAIAGFFVIQAQSLEEAVEVAKGCPGLDFGIRIALGAQARNIVNLVIKQGLWPVAVGLTIGILAGLLFARFIVALLYGVSAYDPIALLLTVLVLGIASLLACLLPAVRAIRINPTKVLNE